MKGVPFPAAPHTSSLLVLVWLQSNVKHVSTDAVMNRVAKKDAASPFFSCRSVLAVGLHSRKHRKKNTYTLG